MLKRIWAVAVFAAMALFGGAALAAEVPTTTAKSPVIPASGITIPGVDNKVTKDHVRVAQRRGRRLRRSSRRRNRRWRRRGAAVAAGALIVGAAIAASQAPRYSRSPRCRKWRRWCRRGNDRACYRFDRYC